MVGISWISNLHRAVSFSVLLQRHCSTPIVAHHKHRGQRWISEFRKFSKSKVSPKKKIAPPGARKNYDVIRSRAWHWMKFWIYMGVNYYDSKKVVQIQRQCRGYETAANTDSIRRFLKTVIASIASMATLRNLSRFTLLESFLAPSLTNGPNFHCTRVKNNQICELLPSLNSCCEGA